LDIFPLHIFPASSLASSVVTTVWVGVTVVAFFNLRLGWVLSGLIVPGYIVPLLILKPWSAVIVFIEGIITYLIVWMLFERLSKIGAWGSIFGRDRFFALVLVSVGVRIGFDGWVWPGIGLWVNDFFGLNFDYRNNLQSFGLVVIALIANQFWKSGVLRGLIPSVVIIAIVYLIIRYGFMPYTNFTISNVGYMYEDIASSILASPKAYIILLCAAFIASRMNLLYGWDFSGILIPSLLALQWYQPGKILASFVEAFVILLLARGLLATRLFKNANIEGARKLLLFFNIGFAYKFLLAYAVLWLYPQMKVTDTYAFGYLLATLLALKMHDKDIAIRMTRATLQTSLVGVLVASLIGYGLTLLPVGAVYEGVQDNGTVTIVDNNHIKLIDRLQQDKIRFYSTVGVIQPVPLPHELEIFSAAMSALVEYRKTEKIQYLNTAVLKLAKIGFAVEKIDKQYLYMSENSNIRGWGSYVLNMNHTSGLLISVPQPLEERGALEAAEVFFKTSNAHAMAVAGSLSDNNPDQSSSVLLNSQTIFQAFHRSLARRDVLQVRAYSDDLQRSLEGLRPGSSSQDLDQLPSRLWIKGSLPESLNLPFLKSRTELLEIEWSESPFSNRQRDIVRQGFAELLLNSSALRKVRAYSFLVSSKAAIEVQDQRIDGYLQEWILSGKQSIAASGSDQYVAPTPEQLLFFDEEVMTPLLDLMKREYKQGQWSENGQADLNLIANAAAVMGYHLMQYRHRESGQDFIVLHESPDEKKRKYWGTYVFRLGNTANYMVQVPRPLHEVNSFEYGVALFERLEGIALSIAGADPDANRSGEADLVRNENLLSLFSLVNQVMLRESAEAPMMVIHSRARGYRPDTPVVTEDVLISYKRDTTSPVGKDALSQELLKIMHEDGLSVRYVDGSPETAGYEVGGIPQSRYLAAAKNKQFWVIWLSALARAEYRQQSENKQEVGRFAALEIPTIEVDLYRYLDDKKFGVGSIMPPKDMLTDIRRYLQTQNIVGLRNIQKSWSRFDLLRLIDRDSRQSFLLVLDSKKVPVLVVNLNPRVIDAQVEIQGGMPSRKLISEFINQRAAWLYREAPQ